MTLTACSQITSIKEDSICLFKEDARLIFKNLKLGEVCDSISKHQKEHLQILKIEISGYKEERKILINKNTESEKQLIRANRKVKILGFGVKFGIPIGIVGGFIIAKTI